MASSWLTRAPLIFGLLLMGLVVTVERAYGVDTYILPEDKDWSVKVSHKFARGLVNIGTSPLEVPKKAYIEASRSDTWIETFGRITSGALIGVGRAVIRAGYGGFDVITFPFDINDYDPILEPEYVF